MYVRLLLWVFLSHVDTLGGKCHYSGYGIAPTFQSKVGFKVPLKPRDNRNARCRCSVPEEVILLKRSRYLCSARFRSYLLTILS